MNRAIALLPLLACLAAACVPTTRYHYVPLTAESFQDAQNGEKIPLAHNATAICWTDGETQLVYDALFDGEQLCAEMHSENAARDGKQCIAASEIAAIGIPYEGRSASVIPMASVEIGSCDPADPK